MTYAEFKIETDNGYWSNIYCDSPAQANDHVTGYNSQTGDVRFENYQGDAFIDATDLEHVAIEFEHSGAFSVTL